MPSARFINGGHAGSIPTTHRDVLWSKQNADFLTEINLIHKIYNQIVHAVIFPFFFFNLELFAIFFQSIDY